MNILHLASRLIERELKSSFSDCRTSIQKRKLCGTVARNVNAFKGEREFHTGLISCCFFVFSVWKPPLDDYWGWIFSLTAKRGRTDDNVNNYVHLIQWFVVSDLIYCYYYYDLLIGNFPIISMTEMYFEQKSTIYIHWSLFELLASTNHHILGLNIW